MSSPTIRVWVPMCVCVCVYVCVWACVCVCVCVCVCLQTLSRCMTRAAAQSPQHTSSPSFLLPFCCAAASTSRMCVRSLAQTSGQEAATHYMHNALQKALQGRLGFSLLLHGIHLLHGMHLLHGIHLLHGTCVMDTGDQPQFPTRPCALHFPALMPSSKSEECASSRLLCDVCGMPWCEVCCRPCVCVCVWSAVYRFTYASLPKLVVCYVYTSRSIAGLRCTDLLCKLSTTITCVVCDTPYHRFTVYRRLP